MNKLAFIHFTVIDQIADWKVALRADNNVTIPILAFEESFLCRTLDRGVSCAGRWCEGVASACRSTSLHLWAHGSLTDHRHLLVQLHFHDFQLRWNYGGRLALL